MTLASDFEGGECLDLVGGGRVELQQQLRDLRVVPLVAGDAVDDVEQRDAEPVAGVLVVLERVVQRRRRSPKPSITARARSSASRSASVSPCALIGSLK